MIFKFQKFVFSALLAGVSPHYAHDTHGMHDVVGGGNRHRNYNEGGRMPGTHGVQAPRKLKMLLIGAAFMAVYIGIVIVKFYTSGFVSSDSGAALEALWQVNHRGNKKNQEDDDEFDPSSWMQLKPSSSSMVHKTKNCVMFSNHTRRDALVRVIAYQKDASFQLENLLVHYLQAVRYNEIVIVDNDGVDAKTKAIAEKYVNKGVHLWRCDGTMFEKGELWTQVINVYKNDSQFLMPVDVD
jgi:hypothetical protein